ncbi:hypothetical protein [Halobacterium jilantaiense]|uniref:Uncharacterized protein n=1 Tax=Halobacterium jilantaiense TaxID=355548 RepID=A0A1I0N3V6_9EURY|nr:hypothetical protein [Halobacterium jilantaiense]SEV95427.1 hypothetical protein SAMN04487945_0569 [Halobacterium jilantaiense]
MSALREVQHITRDVAVWFTWFLLTLKVSHGRSYGDLRRLTLVQWLAYVAPLLAVTSVATYVYLNAPPGYRFMFAAGGGLGLATGGTLVASTLLVTKLVDISFTYR